MKTTFQKSSSFPFRYTCMSFCEGYKDIVCLWHLYKANLYISSIMHFAYFTNFFPFIPILQYGTNFLWNFFLSPMEFSHYKFFFGFIFQQQGILSASAYKQNNSLKHAGLWIIKSVLQHNWKYKVHYHFLF